MTRMSIVTIMGKGTVMETDITAGKPVRAVPEMEPAGGEWHERAQVLVIPLQIGSLPFWLLWMAMLLRVVR